MTRLKSLLFAVATLAAAIVPGVLIGYLFPITGWLDVLLRVAVGTAWGFLVGCITARYFLRKLREWGPKDW